MAGRPGSKGSAKKTKTKGRPNSDEPKQGKSSGSEEKEDHSTSDGAENQRKPRRRRNESPKTRVAGAAASSARAPSPDNIVGEQSGSGGDSDSDYEEFDNVESLRRTPSPVKVKKAANTDVKLSPEVIKMFYEGYGAENINNAKEATKNSDSDVWIEMEDFKKDCSNTTKPSQNNLAQMMYDFANLDYDGDGDTPQLRASKEVLELVAFLLGRYKDLKKERHDLMHDTSEAKAIMTDCLDFACARYFEYHAFPSMKVSTTICFPEILPAIKTSPAACIRNKNSHAAGTVTHWMLLV